MLEGETLEEVKDFRYLGSIVDTLRGTEADVNKKDQQSKGSFPPVEKCVEVKGNWRNHQNTLV